MCHAELIKIAMNRCGIHTYEYHYVGDYVYEAYNSLVTVYITIVNNKITEIIVD